MNIILTPSGRRQVAWNMHQLLKMHDDKAINRVIKVHEANVFGGGGNTKRRLAAKLGMRKLRAE